MKFPRKVVIAVDLADDIEQIFLPLKRMDFMKESTISFVHVSMTVAYSFVLDFGAFVYPVPEDRSMIEQAVLAKINSIKDKIVPQGFEGVSSAHCLFAENQAQAFCNFAKENLADLIIVAPRKKHGIFESSFANYVMKHSEANVLLLKPH